MSFPPLIFASPLCDGANVASRQSTRRRSFGGDVGSKVVEFGVVDGSKIIIVNKSLGSIVFGVIDGIGCPLWEEIT